MAETESLELTGPWQVVVIGAGPAGAVCALRLARAGKKVLLVDRAVFPRPKVCGSCISARTLELMRSAGLHGLIDEHMDKVQAPAISQISLRTAGGAINLPLREGRAISRASLDLAIIDLARAAGAVFAQGLSASVLDDDPQSSSARRIALHPAGAAAGVGEITIESQCVVVADGVGGQSLAHLNGPEKADVRAIVSTTSRIGAGTVVDDCSKEGHDFYKSGTIYMALHRYGYVGAVRLEQNKIDLGAAFDLNFVRKTGSAALAAKAIMESSGMPFLESFADGHWLGTAAFTRRRMKPAGQRLFIIGDAASYGEPFTGEGIGWAINSALLVVPYVLTAIEKWDDNLVLSWQKEQARTIVENQKTSLHLGKLLRQSHISAQLIEKVLKSIPALSRKFLAGDDESKNAADKIMAPR